jgi:RNA polymerase sigma-70 factor (ECF subfamily)
MKAEALMNPEAVAAAIYPLHYDAELMLAVQRGDTASFELLVRRYRGAVLNYVFRMVHSYTAAEDLSQDVFLRVYRSRHTYQPTAKFTTWLFRIATNISLNYRRDQRHIRRQLALDDQTCDEIAPLQLHDRKPSAESTLLRQCRATEVRVAIGTLPFKQKTAVLLHKYEEMDYSEIARVLDTSIPAVKSLLFRAYAALRQTLQHLS